MNNEELERLTDALDDLEKATVYFRDRLIGIDLVGEEIRQPFADVIFSDVRFISRILDDRFSKIIRSLNLEAK